MKTRSPLLLVTWIVAILFAACGNGEDAKEGVGGSPEDRAEREASRFVPSADQFGVESFKIVYELEGQETGTRTLWIEDHGARVGMEWEVEIYGENQHKAYYWDGTRGHLKDLPDGSVYTTRLRVKASEPTSFATMAAENLKRAGYEHVGDEVILGKTCEHWTQKSLHLDGSRYKGIEFRFVTGLMQEKVVQRAKAIEFEEGTSIPDRIKALADG